jgi:multiple sugar transport system permease protein
MRKIRSSRPKQGRQAFFLLLPVMFGFAAVYIYPTFRGIYLSFTHTIDLGSTGDWVGMAMYRKLWNDPLFWNAIRVTFQYVFINIGSQTIFALALAVAIDRLAKSTWVRIALLMPWLIPGITTAMLYTWILSPSLGVVNQALAAMHLKTYEFFSSDAMAMPTVALVNTWRYVGYTSLLIFAGIQMIPKSMYEAGAIDGATEWRLFRSITLPLLRPVLTMVMIVSFIGSFQIFDTIVVALSNGGANSGDALRALNYYIYQKTFMEYKIGYGAAMATVLLIFLAIFSLFQMKISRANESDLGSS